MTYPTLAAIDRPSSLTASLPLQALQNSLEQRRFFKLISGGSFTEAEKITHLVRAYAIAGADCIDIAPDPMVLQAVSDALYGLPKPHPVVMVSLPLDPDPHFRKIDLTESDCIRCGLCLPICPTEALSLPEALEISQSLCYGCGRCVPVCPTDALSLLPFQVEDQIEKVLSHPLVEAIEIHSRYVDPYMLSTFMDRWQPLLAEKMISLCFRPTEIPPSQILDFYHIADQKSSLPVMLQIDGAPMSGNDDPEASRPALEAAAYTATLFKEADQELPWITISGGINHHSAQHLKENPYHFIAGVGMGTVARKTIWSQEPESAAHTAAHLVSEFKTR